MAEEAKRMEKMQFNAKEMFKTAYELHSLLPISDLCVTRFSLHKWLFVLELKQITIYV